MVGSIEPVENGAYRIRHLKVDAEVGDSKVAGFKPRMRLNRWGGECFLDLDFTPEGLEEEEIEEETDAEGNITKVKWKIKTADDEMEFEFYPVEPREEILVVNGEDHRFLQCDEGGFEWKPVFKKKPKKLVWKFPLQTKDLNYYYQSPLHPDHPTWIDTTGDGKPNCLRPENVVGSYAAYHATKMNNKYKTGKAFHLYYPYLIDAEGWKVRVEGFNVSDGMMTITLPHQFLDDATYPVVLDPIFGNNIPGGSWDWYAQGMTPLRLGTAWVMPAPGGTGNTIYAYLKEALDSMGFNMFSGINEKDSCGANCHDEVDGGTKAGVWPAVAGEWIDIALVGNILTEGVTYILNSRPTALDASNKGYLAYDDDGVDSYNVFVPLGPAADPWNAPVDSDKKYSIYVDYTAAGWTGKISGVTDPAKIAGVDVANIASVKGVA